MALSLTVYPEHRRRVEAALADPRLGGRWYVVSACRSNELQKRLYADYLAGRGPLAAIPGRSPHEIGAPPWRDAFCHATDLGRHGGNPPGGYIPNRKGPRHPEWALLEQVCNDHGLVRTVQKEEWHVQLSGSAPVHIPPRPGETEYLDLTGDEHQLLQSAQEQAVEARRLAVEQAKRTAAVETKLDRLDMLVTGLFDDLVSDGRDILADHHGVGRNTPGRRLLERISSQVHRT